MARAPRQGGAVPGGKVPRLWPCLPLSASAPLPHPARLPRAGSPAGSPRSRRTPFLCRFPKASVDQSLHRTVHCHCGLFPRDVCRIGLSVAVERRCPLLRVALWNRVLGCSGVPGEPEKNHCNHWLALVTVIIPPNRKLQSKTRRDQGRDGRRSRSAAVRSCESACQGWFSSSWFFPNEPGTSWVLSQSACECLLN